MAILSALKSLIGFGPRPWPEGEPVVAGGERVGTVLPGGSVSFAPGLRVTPLPLCSRCQQAVEAEGHQQPAGNVERHAQRARDAGV